MSRCLTTSGMFRCELDAGHAGECTARADEYATARLPCVIAAVHVDRERATLPAPSEEKNK